MNDQSFSETKSEGRPEPFAEPRTIPAAWDVSVWLDPMGINSLDHNGAAYNETNPTFSLPYDKVKDAV